MYNNIDNKISYWIPYSFVPEFLQHIKFNENPIVKVFVSGSITNVYPLRILASKMKNTITLNHPSYTKYKHNIIN